MYTFEKFSFVFKVDLLDKNETLLAHEIPTGAIPVIVGPDPTPNATESIEVSLKNVDTFFLFKLFF